MSLTAIEKKQLRMATDDAISTMAIEDRDAFRDSIGGNDDLARDLITSYKDKMLPQLATHIEYLQAKTEETQKQIDLLNS